MKTSSPSALKAHADSHRQPIDKPSKFWLVEKANHNALHAIFDSQTSAERHLREVIPDFCLRGIFMDKTLRPESFEIIPGRY